VCLDFAQLTPSILNLALSSGFYDPKMGSWLHAAGTMGGLCVFGSIHLVAWNFSFPTATEQLLWRIAAASIAVTSFLLTPHLLFGAAFWAGKFRTSRFAAVVQFVAAVTGWGIALAIRCFEGLSSRGGFPVDLFPSAKYLRRDLCGEHSACWIVTVVRVG
jgi:hypothetical protein